MTPAKGRAGRARRAFAVAPGRATPGDIVIRPAASRARLNRSGETALLVAVQKDTEAP